MAKSYRPVLRTSRSCCLPTCGNGCRPITSCGSCLTPSMCLISAISTGVVAAAGPGRPAMTRRCCWGCWSTPTAAGSGRHARSSGSVPPTSRSGSCAPVHAGPLHNRAVPRRVSGRVRDTVHTDPDHRRPGRVGELRHRRDRWHQDRGERLDRRQPRPRMAERTGLLSAVAECWCRAWSAPDADGLAPDSVEALLRRDSSTISPTMSGTTPTETDAGPPCPSAGSRSPQPRRHHRLIGALRSPSSTTNGPNNAATRASI